jgi:HK97 family phage prohead protease
MTKEGNREAKMPIENKMIENYIDMEIKLDETDEGKFEGYAAVFNNIDYGLDIIEPGAFAKTLKDSKKRALLYMHDYNMEIVGEVTLKEDDHGLLAKGQVYLDTEKGQHYFKLMKKKIIDRMSIGYRAIKKEWLEKVINKVKERIRKLKEVRLFEVSLIPVAMAMNPKALITDVKTFNDLYEFIKENKNDKEFKDKVLSLLGELPEPSTKVEPEKSTQPEPEKKTTVTEQEPKETDYQKFLKCYYELEKKQGGKNGE